jgi:ubiquitin C-terminal hydrolase
VDKLHTIAEGHLDDGDKKCPCFFHKAFYGKLRSSVTCDKCGNVTRTEDPMVDLSLDVQVQAKKRQLGGLGSSSTPTLSGCLESFTSPERLTAGVYNCSGCGGTPQKATKQLRIKKLPMILCMQLKVGFHLLSKSSHSFCTHRVNGTLQLMHQISASNTRPRFQKRWKARWTSPCPLICCRTRQRHTPKAPSSRSTCTTLPPR